MAAGRTDQQYVRAISSLARAARGASAPIGGELSEIGAVEKLNIFVARTNI